MLSNYRSFVNKNLDFALGMSYNSKNFGVRSKDVPRLIGVKIATYFSIKVFGGFVLNIIEFLPEIDWVFVSSLLIAFGLKFADTMLGTAKTIYLTREKYWVGGLLAALGNFFYLLAIVRIANADGIAGIIAMCLATLIGTALPGILIRKVEGDSLYVFEITSTTVEKGLEFVDHLRDCDMAFQTTMIYDKDKQKSLQIKVYSDTRQKSRTLTSIIPNEFTWCAYSPRKDSGKYFSE